MKLSMLPIQNIIIPPNRQRQTFNSARHVELVDTIADQGLLHPLTVREQAGLFYLVAGERRLRACKELTELGQRIKFNSELLPLNCLPVNNLGTLDELEAEEIEYAENMKRADLTWSEEAQATQRLYALKKARKEISNAVAVKEIVKEVKESREAAGMLVGLDEATIRTDVYNKLRLAEALDNEKVSKARTQAEALRILKSEERRTTNEALAKVVGASFSAKAHVVIHGDSLQWMEEAPAGYFDVILTDPPYGMNAHKNNNTREGYSNITHEYDDTPEAWQELMRAWAPLAYKVTKDQAHAYVFCDLDNFVELRGIMTAVGWSVFRTPLVYFKQHVGRVSWPEYGPRRQYELCLYALKGEKKVNAIYSDVIPATSDPNLGHAAQKPISLFQNLLQRSITPGDRILDPFAGSGPIFPAAHTLKCAATGIEKNANGYGICLQRIKDLDKLS